MTNDIRCQNRKVPIAFFLLKFIIMQSGSGCKISDIQPVID